MVTYQWQTMPAQVRKGHKAIPTKRAKKDIHSTYGRKPCKMIHPVKVHFIKFGSEGGGGVKFLVVKVT